MKKKRKKMTNRQRQIQRIRMMILGMAVMIVVLLAIILVMGSQLKKNRTESTAEAVTSETSGADTDTSSAADSAVDTEETETEADTEIAAEADGWDHGSAEDPLAEETLLIDEDPDMYLYTDMLKDKDILLAQYPDILAAMDLGTTADNREIWVFRIGSEDAPNKILIHAGIHAREYMTCQISMKQLSEFLKSYEAGESYGGYTLEELVSNTAIYIIPMINPDGMSISQLGMDGVQTEETRSFLQEIADADGSSLSDSTYLTRWKANARGVDLNRNFDALWDTYAGAGHISSDHYKGESIGCEVESSILISFTEEEMFDRTISYHTQGSVVYWYFAQGEPLKSATLAYAKRLGEITGYPLDANYEQLDPAGYKDWCVAKMDIPSVTIEVGYGTSPVPVSQFQKIWEENQYVIQESLIDIIENPYKPAGSGSNTTDIVQTADTTSANGDTYVVVNCKEFVNLRSMADTSADVITTIPLGEEVTFIGEAYNGFYLVSYQGQSGYVNASYLKKKN